MTVSLHLSSEAETALRQAWGPDLARAALEALAIEGYRTGKLSRHQVQALLGFPDRWETESWLGSRGVSLNYDIAELEADRAALARALGPVSR